VGDIRRLLKRNSKQEAKTEYNFQAPAVSADKVQLVDKTSGLSFVGLWWFLVLGLTGLAFLMRRKGLATQSLWFDETDLVSRASQDLPAILKSFFKPGENGPLYTLFMHFWVQLAGTGEAAVRTPSLIAGTLAVPLIFLVGRKLGGLAVGLVAALLLTVSPYHLWYSQDAKMYPLALCLTLASVYFFLRGLESNKKGWWFAYVIITTLGFYIHLMTVLIVAVELTYFLVSRFIHKATLRAEFKVQSSNSTHSKGLFSSKNGVSNFVSENSKSGIQSLELEIWNLKPGTRKLALISLGLLTLPYLPIALWQLVALRDGTVGNGWFQPVGLLEMLNTLGRRFGVNRSLEPWETIGALTFAGLAGLGLVVIWRGLGQRFRVSRPVALFLTIYLVLPILAFYGLTTRLPLFADRYLLIASPAYYLLVACGLVWLAQRSWPLGLAALGLGLVCAVIALRSFNYSTEPQKEDWRGAMRWLSEQVRPGDEVFVIPGYLDSAVKYYFKPGFDVPLITVPGDILDDHDDVQLNDFLQKAIRGHERAWLITSPDRYSQEDKKQFVRTGWFDYNTAMFSDPAVKVGVTIYGYSFKLIPGTNTEFFPRTATTDYQVGDGLRLEGYNYSSASGLATGTVRYGDYLHLSFFWRKLNFDTASYVMKVRLLDKEGRDTGTSYAALPLNGYFTTDRWHRNEAVRDYRDLFIHVPPGEYQLELSVYPANDPQAPLLVQGSEQEKQVNGAAQILLKQPIIVQSAVAK